MVNELYCTITAAGMRIALLYCIGWLDNSVWQPWELMMWCGGAFISLRPAQWKREYYGAINKGECESCTIIQRQCHLVVVCTFNLYQIRWKDISVLDYFLCRAAQQSDQTDCDWTITLCGLKWPFAVRLQSVQGSESTGHTSPAVTHHSMISASQRKHSHEPD